MPVDTVAMRVRPAGSESVSRYTSCPVKVMLLTVQLNATCAFPADELKTISGVPVDAVKVAVTVWFAFMVTVVVDDVPLAPPLQPLKV